VKIGMMTWGSEGDVRPLLALAAGLSRAGHRVTLAAADITGREYARYASVFDVAIRPVQSMTWDKAELYRFDAEVLSKRDSIAQLHAIVSRVLDPMAEELLAVAKRIATENELLIGHFLAYPFRIAAEKAKRPCVTVQLVPSVPSRYLTPAEAPRLGRWANALFWKLGDVLLSRRLTPAVNRMRAREGLAAIQSMIRDVWCSPTLTLIATSPTLYPPAPDWPSQVATCGALELPSDSDSWRPPSELEQFLGSGPPPVYMTTGSMAMAEKEPQEIVDILSEAALLARCRAIIQTETGVNPQDASILFIERVPHHLVFPRCAAIVHHGGAGTTQAASKAGRPSVIVIHACDQIYWANTLRHAGIAPKPLFRKSVRPKTLARAIRRVLDSQAMAEKAKEIGRSMQREDGVANAVRLIESLSTRSP
jgi:sterol 3beta-glucosyltransferase